jgi:hypothetical protein
MSEETGVKPKVRTCLVGLAAAIVGASACTTTTTVGGSSDIKWPASSAAISADVCANSTYLQSPYTTVSDIESALGGTWTEIPAGDDASYNGTLDTAGNYFFDPGDHTDVNFSPAANSQFFGGYNSTSGEATIDGTGNTNDLAINSTNARVTIEYLTIDHYNNTGSFGGSIVNQDGGAYWTLEHDTVGPNGNIQQSPTAVDSDYGYGIGVGSDNTIDYDCVTENGEGGFNNGTDIEATGIYGPDTQQGNSYGPYEAVIDHDEISKNGLGEWPDPCGCNAGLKLFFAENITIDDDWVHDNYGVGLWPDTDNAGFDMSHDIIASNWGRGIMYEVSSNANITDDYIYGNLWASDGSWPTCTGNSQAPCQYGEAGNGSGRGGPGGFTYTALYLSGSGGSDTPSRYQDQMNVTGDDFDNNWGGIYAHMTEDQWCGSLFFATGSNGTSTSETCPTDDYSTYSGDLPIYTTSGAVNGTTITATSGTFVRSQQGGSVAYTPPSGDYVYGPGIPAGDKIASCSSDTTCTLSAAATNNAGPIEIDIGPDTGCGAYNLSGTSWGNAYYDHCNWWVDKLNVSDDTFSTNATAITAGGYACTQSNGCGYNAIAASSGKQPGVAFDPYSSQVTSDICNISKTDNVFSNNTYSWTGSGAWSFYYCDQGVQVSQATWLADGQDAGSSGL